MSSEDEAGVLVGLSRRDAAPGMSATTEHVLQERGFDLVAALFGTPDAERGKLPDAALALLMHGIILDFVARRMPGPGSEVLAQDIRFVMDPAVGDTVVVSGTLASRPAEDTANIVLTRGLRPRPPGRRQRAGAPARRAGHAAAGGAARHHPAQPSPPRAADAKRRPRTRR